MSTLPQRFPTVLAVLAAVPLALSACGGGSTAAPEVAHVAAAGSAAPTPKATALDQDSRPLIRVDTSQEEIDRYDKAYWKCLTDHGSPDTISLKKNGDDQRVVARYEKAKKPCAAMEPEELTERVKRKDPGDYADRTREWVRCMRQHGLHIEVDASGVWGFSNDYAAAELGSPWVDTCETKAFTGVKV